MKGFWKVAMLMHEGEDIAQPKWQSGLGPSLEFHQKNVGSARDAKRVSLEIRRATIEIPFKIKISIFIFSRDNIMMLTAKWKGHSDTVY